MKAGPDLAFIWMLLCYASITLGHSQWAEREGKASLNINY